MSGLRVSFLPSRALGVSKDQHAKDSKNEGDPFFQIFFKTYFNGACNNRHVASSSQV